MIIRRAAAALVAAMALLVSVSALVENGYDRDVSEAIEFCDALVPKLKSYRDEQGRYPDNIDASWYGSTVPSLIRVPDFYAVSGSGEGYLLRVRDPRVDPRFWFNDVYGYSSREGKWRQYDGY